MTTFVIILLFAIVFSNILDSAFPAFPLPIIQIALGVIIALTPLDTRIALEPEIFMGVLVAPLLYREAEEADFSALWKVRREVVFMVFGLVFATVLVIGFSLNYFVGAIPLAACFCLGGILGPTDAIAVSSVSKRVDIEPKVMAILKGEFLINDASGVIAFNFASLALITGSFSLGRASLTFAVVCLGGVAIGFVIELVKEYFVRALKRAQITNAAAFTIMEILVPFLCYFIAEEIGFSGILAAVTAGCRQALTLRKIDIFEARFAVVKKSLWEMITVVFNSFIFILLGLQLPIIISDVYYDADYTIAFALKLGLFVTGVLFAVRYIGVLIAGRGLPGENRREAMRNRLVLTLSGVKGTVSLATAFALPFIAAGGSAFEQRDLLLLITGSAIIYSLVIATVLLPLVAKTKAPAHKNELRNSILHGAIGSADITDGNFLRRLAQDPDAEFNVELKLNYDSERETLAEYIKEGKISEEEADEIRVEINTLENYSIEELKDSSLLRLVASGARRRHQRRNKKKRRHERRI